MLYLRFRTGIWTIFYSKTNPNTIEENIEINRQRGCQFRGRAKGATVYSLEAAVDNFFFFGKPLVLYNNASGLL